MFSRGVVGLLRVSINQDEWCLCELLSCDRMFRVNNQQSNHPHRPNAPALRSPRPTTVSSPMPRSPGVSRRLPRLARVPPRLFKEFPPPLRLPLLPWPILRALRRCASRVWCRLVRFSSSLNHVLGRLPCCSARLRRPPMIFSAQLRVFDWPSLRHGCLFSVPRAHIFPVNVQCLLLNNMP